MNSQSHTGADAGEAEAENMLRSLSLEEKVALMSGKGFYQSAAKRIRGLVFEPYCIGGRSEALGFDGIYFSDGPRGCTMGRSTCFPVAIARGASFDVDLEERVGDAIGKEVRAQGCNTFGGVCINLLRHPAWGRAQEGYGEDPVLLGEMGAAITRGVQRHNVVATVKHFALNSIENSRFKVNVRADERVLREVYLPHFKRVIDEGAGAVMSAYNKVNSFYCGHNRHLLTEILRNDWGFDGVVMSDWILGCYGPDAAEAGLDIEAPEPRFYGETLIEAVRDGRVPESAVDRAVRNILALQLRFFRKADPQIYDISLVASPAHRLLAREAAEAGAVLLKNDRGLLPLERSTLRRVALIGPLAETGNLGDNGSSRVMPPEIVTLAEGLRAALEPYCRLTVHDGASLDEAVALARGADAVILAVGLTAEDEGEYIAIPVPAKDGGAPTTREIGGDRLSLSLDPAQDLLVKAVVRANPNSIVTLIGGSAIMMDHWKNDVAAILMLWYPGMEGGHAAARLLLGEATPGGKLPFSIPAREEDLPFFRSETDEIEYGLFHGYTKLEREGLTPAFPFGFGLSYTNFRIGEPAMVREGDGWTFRVEVTNTGKRAGSEVVQLYLGLERSRIERARKLLRGFRKVHLAPGESADVVLTLSRDDLAYWNEAVNDWAIEDIPYTAYIGTSSRREDLQAVEFSL